MITDSESTSTSKVMTWSGYILSGLIVLMLLFSGGMKVAGPPELAKEFTRLGWPANLALAIGMVEVACAIFYAIPKTSVLGAILVTGYLGGAIATHVRIEDPFLPPAIAGVFAWLALYLRDPRVRELIPLRR